MAEAARLMQVTLQAMTVADATKLWQVLDFDRLGETWEPWVTLMSAHIRAHHKASTDNAALFYRASRQVVVGDPGSPSIVVRAIEPDDEWIRNSLGFSAIASYQRSLLAGKSEPEASNAALALTLGTTTRIASDGGRSTIKLSSDADEKAFGWYRITDEDPCAFCAMLAARGPVYHSARTAGRVAGNAGKQDTDWHNGCGCSVAPAFESSYEKPALSLEATRIYNAVTATSQGKDKIAAFRAAWEKAHPRPRKKPKPKLPVAA